MRSLVILCDLFQGIFFLLLLIFGGRNFLGEIFCEKIFETNFVGEILRERETFRGKFLFYPCHTPFSRCGYDPLPNIWSWRIIRTNQVMCRNWMQQTLQVVVANFDEDSVTL